MLVLFLQSLGDEKETPQITFIQETSRLKGPQGLMGVTLRPFGWGICGAQEDTW